MSIQPHQLYELEKLHEFQQAELKKLEREGAYIKNQNEEVPRVCILAKMMKLFRRFNIAKSHPRQ